MMSLSLEGVMQLAPVIPVLVVDRVEDALPIARALVKGGLPALEVTLRTPAALDVIREMAQVEGAVVGAGTVLNPGQLDAAMAAGARSEEHTSELQSLMRISYAVFCLKKKKYKTQ